MVDTPTPDPTLSSDPNVSDSGGYAIGAAVAGLDRKAPSVVKLTLAGCGGCGMNLTRPFLGKNPSANVFYFDTSMTNSRSDEYVHIVTNGNGSGSHRAENAIDIERKVTSMSDEELGVADVGVVVFSAPGGSGSVIGPMIVRQYARKGMRVIAVVVADTSSAVGAKNTINTLKTLAKIAENNDLYLPLIVLSNDQPKDRFGVNAASQQIISDLVELLTQPVFEVDRNDRMNWINPSKVVGGKPGLKLMKLHSELSPTDEQIVVGLHSAEMVDSVLVTMPNGEQEMPFGGIPMNRLKKIGFYYKDFRPIVGTVTGDIKPINDIIDRVERVQQTDKGQRYEEVDRLKSSGDDDMIL